MWPTFIAVTLVDALILHLLPPIGEGVNFIPALLIATFGNLILIGVIGPWLARRTWKRRPAAEPAARGAVRPDRDGPARGDDRRRHRRRPGRAPARGGRDRGEGAGRRDALLVRAGERLRRAPPQPGGVGHGQVVRRLLPRLHPLRRPPLVDLLPDRRAHRAREDQGGPEPRAEPAALGQLDDLQPVAAGLERGLGELERVVLGLATVEVEAPRRRADAAVHR